MTMREKMARAIVAGLVESDPGAYIHEKGLLGEDDMTGGFGTIDGRFSLAPVIDLVLDAIRAPTEGVIEAGEPHVEGFFVQAWQAAIDAAKDGA